MLWDTKMVTFAETIRAHYQKQSLVVTGFVFFPSQQNTNAHDLVCPPPPYSSTLQPSNCSIQDRIYQPLHCSPVTPLVPVSCSRNSEWLLDDRSLQLVVATALFLAALSSRPATCAWEVTGMGVTFVMYTPPGWEGSSLISCTCWRGGLLWEEEGEGERRSRIVSL